MRRGRTKMPLLNEPNCAPAWTLRRRRKALVPSPALAAMVTQLRGAAPAAAGGGAKHARRRHRTRRNALLPLSPRQMRALRDEMDLPIGTRGDPFARWEVIQDDYERAPAGIIGSGATAVVLMVRDRADPKRLAALKKIPLRHPLALSYSGTTPRSAVRQELHVLRHLSRGAAQHSGVARLIEAYEHEGCAYLALELCGGGDLFTAANRMIATKTRWSEAALRSIARELLAALAHTHALGVAHRDVKPENVLFRDARGARCGRGVVLSDFGTATVVAAEHEGALLRRCRSESFDSAVSSECEELERNDTANGTPLFLAPELMPLFRSDERSRRLMPRALLAMAECRKLPVLTTIAPPSSRR